MDKKNSLSYINTYALDGVTDFVRTTIRYSTFCSGWDAIIQLQLTDETSMERNENDTIKSWFTKHLSNRNLQALYHNMLLDPTLKTQLDFIGFDANTMIPVYLDSNAAILQWILEDKWKLEEADKDMVVMMHEITYLLDNQIRKIESSLVLKGKNKEETAMATTVGLPLAMSVCAYLKGEIKLTGLHIPIHPSIYTPILKFLAEEGVVFNETEL